MTDAQHEDVNRTLGRIEGTLRGVTDKLTKIGDTQTEQGETLAGIKPVIAEHRKRISTVEHAVAKHGTAITKARGGYAWLVAAGAAILAAGTALMSLWKAV